MGNGVRASGVAGTSAKHSNAFEAIAPVIKDVYDEGLVVTSSLGSLSYRYD